MSRYTAYFTNKLRRRSELAVRLELVLAYLDTTQQQIVADGGFFDKTAPHEQLSFGYVSNGRLHVVKVLHNCTSYRLGHSVVTAEVWRDEYHMHLAKKRRGEL